MDITLTQIVVAGRFDGRCFFCGQPLENFGANVRAAPQLYAKVRVVGYACGDCATTHERTGRPSSSNEVG
jgi:hypothetical protein